MGEALNELRQTSAQLFKDIPADFIEDIERQYEERAKEFVEQRKRFDVVKLQLLETVLKFPMQREESQYSGTIYDIVCGNSIYLPRIWDAGNNGHGKLIPEHDCTPGFDSNLDDVNNIVLPTSNDPKAARTQTDKNAPLVKIAARTDKIRRLCKRYGAVNEDGLRAMGVKIDD